MTRHPPIPRLAGDTNEALGAFVLTLRQALKDAYDHLDTIANPDTTTDTKH